MSCSPTDIKDYLLGELSAADARRVEEHLTACRSCHEELERLRVTQAALCTLPEEEPPRRTAFVSDKVFEPSWWRRLWISVPKLGFASALLLSVSILVHTFARPAPVIVLSQPDTARIQARVEAEVARRVQAEVAQVIVASEARQHEKSAQLVMAAEKRMAFERREDQLAFQEALDVFRKQMGRLYVASADLGGGR